MGLDQRVNKGNVLKKFIGTLIAAILLDIIIVLGLVMAAAYYQLNYSRDAKLERVKAIYATLVAQTGQVQDALPLVIQDSSQINAYNNGEVVVIFTGIIDYANSDDEIALVLGHEIAHGMLRHLAYKEFGSSALEISVAEGNADKLGAVYLMKAGYDICRARDIWLRMGDQGGNYQGGDHPTAAYRFAELNFNCD